MRERAPTRRRVVAMYALLAMIFIAGLVGLAELLRHDHPPAGPPTPELEDEVDSLRDLVDCPVLAPVPEPGALAAPAVAEPEHVTSNLLYDCPTSFDGRTVRYVGEAVGVVFDRGDAAWVQLNDDVYADGFGPLPTHRDFRGGNAGMGALITPSQADLIGAVGGPTQRGDLVDVVATFHRVHRPSAEVAILEVHSLEVVRPGEPFDIPATPGRAVAAVIVAVAALIVVVIERRQRRSR